MVGIINVPSTELIMSVRHFFTITFHLYCHSTMYRNGFQWDFASPFCRLLFFFFVIFFSVFNRCSCYIYIFLSADVLIARCHLIKWIRYCHHCGVRTEMKAFKTEKHRKKKYSFNKNKHWIYSQINPYSMWWNRN